MGRTFGGASTDIITATLTTHVTARTTSAWVRRTGDGGGGFGRVWDKGLTDRLFWEPGDGVYEYDRFFDAGATQAFWGFIGPALNTWGHILIAHDLSVASNDPVIYVDGAVVGFSDSAPGSGTADTNATAYSLGNRASDQARNWAGDLAHFAVWNRILNANEAAAVYRVGPQAVPDYLRWLPLWGIHASEPEFGQALAATATVTGTARSATDPPVVPFSRRYWSMAQEPAAAVGVTYAQLERGIRGMERGVAMGVR